MSRAGNAHRWREALLLALAALMILGTGLGLRDPWPSDEPRFMLMAQRMVESGQWLFPMRGDELYSDKPPLFMWLQAIAWRLVGDWRVAFMLPTLLAALGTLWCVHDLARRLWSRAAARYAAWGLLLTLQFAWQAREAHLDMLVVFWITLANYGLLRHLLRGPDWPMWTLGWFAAGLGVITKGVGVLALAMLLPAAFAAWRGWPGVRLPMRDLRFLAGPAAFALALAAWLVPLWLTVARSGDPALHAYLRDLLVHQTADRYLASWVHPHPPWFYLETMATRWLPLVLLLPWAVPAWRRRLRRHDPRFLLPLAWCVLVVLFFSIPTGKREVYILPALPMLCVALAPLLPGLVRRVGVQRAALGFVLTVGLVASGMAIALAWPGSEVQRRLFLDSAFVDYARLAAVAAAVGAWALGCALWFGRRRAIAALVSALAAGWVLYGLAAYPILNDAQSGRALMRGVGARLGPDAELGLVAWREQLLLWADRPAVTFGFAVPFEAQLRSGLAWQAEAPGERWLLVEDAAMARCIDTDRAQRMDNANRRGWWLVPGDAATECQATGGR